MILATRRNAEWINESSTGRARGLTVRTACNATGKDECVLTGIKADTSTVFVANTSMAWVRAVSHSPAGCDIFTEPVIHLLMQTSFTSPSFVGLQSLIVVTGWKGIVQDRG